jgi:uncharacterized membrane protein
VNTDIPRNPSRAARTYATIAGLGLAISLQAIGYYSRSLQWVGALVPALIQTLLCVLVARTLRRGRVPAIQRIAEMLHADGSPLPPDMRTYTRKITRLWAGTFALLAFINGTAAAQLTPWRIAPAWIDIFDLAIIGIVILGEFSYRRRRYAAFTVRNLGEFLRRLRNVDLRWALLG